MHNIREILDELEPILVSKEGYPPSYSNGVDGNPFDRKFINRAVWKAAIRQP